MHRLSLAQMSHILALAETGSFKRAAEGLRLTQPGLSRSIQAAEEVLDAKLFDRGQSGVAVTPIGQMVVERATAILQESRDLEREIDLLKGLDSGRLVIGAGPFPAEISVLPAMARLIALHPKLQIFLHQQDWHAATEAVRENRVDLAIAETSYAEGFENLSVRLLGRHQVHFFCLAGHPILQQRNPSLAEVASYPVIGVRVPSRVDQVFESAPPRSAGPAAKGIVWPRITIDMIGQGRRLLQGTDGIVSATLTMMEDSLASGEVKRVPVALEGLKLRYGLITRRGRTLSPSARAFVEEIERIEEEVEGREKELYERYVAAPSSRRKRR